MAREVQPAPGEIDLTALEKRLAALPPGPWRWTWDYGNSPRYHWCLTGADPASTIDTNTVTNTTGEFDSDEDGNEVRVCDTPVMSFLADSRALVEALLARVRLAEGILADNKMDHHTAVAIEREACAKAACRWCRDGDVPQRSEVGPFWSHAVLRRSEACPAREIHERTFQEATGNA